MAPFSDIDLRTFDVKNLVWALCEKNQCYSEFCLMDDTDPKISSCAFRLVGLGGWTWTMRRARRCEAKRPAITGGKTRRPSRRRIARARAIRRCLSTLQLRTSCTLGNHSLET